MRKEKKEERYNISIDNAEEGIWQVRFFLEIFSGFLLINIIIKDRIYIVVGRILRFWKPSDG
jgi:hypothetical protein